MQWWMSKLRPLTCGGVTVGLIQAVGQIDFNQIWFQFWLTILNAFIALLFGQDPSEYSGGGTSSLFGSFFL